jgi:membrane-associated protease RseP (regulator of RpoE activity)
VLLVVGLILSHSGSLFQLPTEFFRGSLLVGSLAKVILGSALESAIVDIHPLVIIGWLGLVINSLNLLPAGQLDGGRIVHGIYGRKIARRTTIATLIILGIISIFNPSNPIPLYWAILILFLQRDLERPVMNELTDPDDARAAWGLSILFLMLATLIPLSPSLAGRLGIGG